MALLENSRCRSQSSSSTSATTCINTRSDVKGVDGSSNSRVFVRQPDSSLDRDAPLGQAQPVVTSERIFK